MTRSGDIVREMAKLHDNVVGCDERFSICLNINIIWHCIDVENRLMRPKQINGRHQWIHQKLSQRIRYPLKTVIKPTFYELNCSKCLNRANHKNTQPSFKCTFTSHVLWIMHFVIASGIGSCTVFQLFPSECSR